MMGRNAAFLFIDPIPTTKAGGFRSKTLSGSSPALDSPFKPLFMEAMRQPGRNASSGQRTIQTTKSANPTSAISSPRPSQSQNNSQIRGNLPFHAGSSTTVNKKDGGADNNQLNQLNANFLPDLPRDQQILPVGQKLAVPQGLPQMDSTNARPIQAGLNSISAGRKPDEKSEILMTRAKEPSTTGQDRREIREIQDEIPEERTKDIVEKEFQDRQQICAVRTPTKELNQDIFSGIRQISSREAAFLASDCLPELSGQSFRSGLETFELETPRGQKIHPQWNEAHNGRAPEEPHPVGQNYHSKHERITDSENHSERLWDAESSRSTDSINTIKRSWDAFPVSGDEIHSYEPVIAQFPSLFTVPSRKAAESSREPDEDTLQKLTSEKLNTEVPKHAARLEGSNPGIHVLDICDAFAVPFSQPIVSVFPEAIPPIHLQNPAFPCENPSREFLALDTEVFYSKGEMKGKQPVAAVGGSRLSPVRTGVTSQFQLKGDGDDSMSQRYATVKEESPKQGTIDLKESNSFQVSKKTVSASAFRNDAEIPSRRNQEIQIESPPLSPRAARDPGVNEATALLRPAAPVVIPAQGEISPAPGYSPAGSDVAQVVMGESRPAQAPPEGSMAEVYAEKIEQWQETASRQIVRAVQGSLGSHRSQISLRLIPESLGHIVVRLTMEHNQLSTQISAEKHSTRLLLEQNLSTLRTAFAEQGIQVERLTIAKETLDSREQDSTKNDSPYSRSGRDHSNREETPAGRHSSGGRHSRPNSPGWKDYFNAMDYYQ